MTQDGVFSEAGLHAEARFESIHAAQRRSGQARDLHTKGKEHHFIASFAKEDGADSGVDDSELLSARCMHHES